MTGVKELCWSFLEPQDVMNALYITAFDVDGLNLSFRLSVGDAPQIVGAMENLTVVAPNEARLSCKIADVTPTPTITW